MDGQQRVIPIANCPIAPTLTHTPHLCILFVPSPNTVDAVSHARQAGLAARYPGEVGALASVPSALLRIHSNMGILGVQKENACGKRVMCSVVFGHVLG